MPDAYTQFLQSKVKLAVDEGFDAGECDVNPALKPHQVAMVKWLVAGGRRACFASFGLGKSLMQLETVRIVLGKTGGRGLIVCPLGVRQEFQRDAVQILGWAEPPKFIRRIEEAGETGIYLTNYETVRDGKLDPCEFMVASLDEASCFAPGTIIDSENGPIPIEQIRVGDRIFNASGTDEIRATHRTKIRRAVRLVVRGISILTSDNHRFFTTRGWVRADEIRSGDSLVETETAMRMVRGDYHSPDFTGGSQAILRSILLGEMAEQPRRNAGEDFKGKAQTGGVSNAEESECSMEAATPLRAVRNGLFPEIRQSVKEEILRQSMLGYLANGYALSKSVNGDHLPYARSSRKARGSNQQVSRLGLTVRHGYKETHCRSKSDGESCLARKDEQSALWADVPGAWRKQQIDGSADEAFRSTGQFADGVFHQYRASERTVSIAPELLQGGHCNSRKTNRNRSGWQLASDEEVAISRPSENRNSECARVDSVEILESGSVELDKFRDADGGVYFYDLSATRHPSYSVSGLLVHNCLRGFGGSKTFREFMRLFTGDGGPSGNHRPGKTVPYRFVATATPSPNEYIEMLAYADFLGIMDVSQAKTRFFKRDSTKADKLTLHPHKEREFWLWVASWALFVQRPSDLGCDDEGYALPEMTVNWHEVPSDHTTAGFERSGQKQMFRNAAIGVVDSASEKRNSLPARIEKMMELRADSFDAHRIIWHDLEAEREAIEKAIPGIVTVRGGDSDEHKEHSILGFSDGWFPELAGKPCMLGSGCNFQRHCNWAIFLGIGFKFNDFIQAVHRIYRFLQDRPVRIDIIYTEAEREVRKKLLEKWDNHKKQIENMQKIIKEFGLSKAAMAHTLTRKLGVERVEVKGDGYTLVNNDNVVETRALAEGSVHLILTSIPFSNQYEYSPCYADFGHSESNEQFFAQMDFLTPELLRALAPGRVCAVHVKDRIVPGGMTGLGFQTLYPFHADCIAHYRKHGFGFLGMKSIITDVVRENNQTYRLGWSEQCKDGSKMGCGVPEYLLLFRKPPTDRSDSYADAKVAKAKPVCMDKEGNRVAFNRNLPIIPGSGYSRARWQIDAHAFMRLGGNRLIAPEEMKALAHDQIFRLFRDYSLANVYDFEHHVRIGEELEQTGRLPVTFMLLQPQSWRDDVWTDITRMLTLNGTQAAKGKEMHLCPMQFDLADRVIAQFSMPGETVLDPFGGLMTVPYRAIKAKRYGIGFELNPAYFVDGAQYCKAMEMEVTTPTLFSLEEMAKTEVEA